MFTAKDQVPSSDVTNGGNKTYDYNADSENMLSSVFKLADGARHVKSVGRQLWTPTGSDKGS